MSHPLDIVLAYHERTKHHFQRYAAGPGGLDWATQPAPFRTFAGSPQVALPLLSDTTLQTRYADLYQPGAIAPHAFTLANIAALLELALGLSAWKEYGATRWALRCNPSSGNLHPTEAYVVVQGLAGIADGVHHYLSRDHVLEQRCDLRADLPTETFLLGLTSIHWREAWKYGERAYRYCQHDAGHAIAAARYAAAALGWQASVLGDWSDADIASLLGLDREMDFGDAEREHPDVMMVIGRDAAYRIAKTSVAQAWYGKANRLSPSHAHDWPVIESVAAACVKPATQEAAWRAPPRPDLLPLANEVRAVDIIKQRRSAQEFDGVTSITADTLFRMLDLTLPRAAVPPWDAIDWAPRIHLALFVHRVEGLMPGVYLFLRNADIESKMRAELSDEFQWVRAEGCPAHLPLYRVAEADARNAAKALSCHQNIAADGAFSLGMLAEYESSLAHGAWMYRQLFWEAGILGQVLYLEAEAAGVRGTGIGCYFDDGVHDVLGIKGHWLQSMYHFTIGGALTDTRLETLSAYAHLKREFIE